MTKNYLSNVTISGAAVFAGLLFNLNLGCSAKGDAAAVAAATPVHIISCPTGYVGVPANSTLGTSDFCIAKYEMKVMTNAGATVFDGYHGGVAYDVTLYKPDSRANGVPWVKLLHTEVISECASLGTGYHLVTAKEWNATARNIELTASNWSSGTVGVGEINRGNQDGTPSATSVADGYAVAAATDLLSADVDSLPYAGTGNNAGQAWGSGADQKRTWTLSTGDIVWDLGGNARERVDIDGLGSTMSYQITSGDTAGNNFYEVFGAELSSAVAGMTLSGGGTVNLNWFTPATAGLTDTANFIGPIYIAGGAQVGRVLTKGANFSNPGGLYAGDMDGDAVTRSGSAGFRCVAPAL